jgi:hypothetical protein
MSWRDFKNSRFKEKAYEKNNISPPNCNDNNDKRVEGGTFVTFVTNVIRDKTENQVITTGQSQEELEAERNEMALKVIKKIEEEHNKNGGVPYFATPEILQAEQQVCLTNKEVLAERATNQEFRVACDKWLNTAISTFLHNDNNDNSDKSPFFLQIQGADEEKELLEWFDSAELPTQPFDLDQSRRVSNPGKFYAVLKQEIESRLVSPRWKCGATQADIRALKAILI